MKRKNFTAIIVLAVLFALAGAASALAGGVVGRFTVVDGRVDILRPGQTRAEPVARDATVTAGDIVRTKSDSFAEIVFNDGAVLKVSESSRIEIKDYELTGNGKRKMGLLRLLRGKIRATVPKTLGRIIPISRGPSNFEVETPTAVAGARGTDFFVWFDRGTTGVFVLDGTVETRSPLHPEKALMVGGGYFTLIHPGEEALKVSAIRNRSLLVREGENLSRHAELEEARKVRKARHNGYGEDIGHLNEREIIAGGSFERRDWDERSEPHESLERPVTETHTALLTESHFSGALTGRGTGASVLDITSTSFTGEWEGNGTWGAALTGTFATACPSCAFALTGTASGTDSNGGAFSGIITSGTWSSGAWSADISGTKTGGSFSGTLSGTYSSSTGTVQGTGTGTWQ
jgi:hypothetical protein